MLRSHVAVHTFFLPDMSLRFLGNKALSELSAKSSRSEYPQPSRVYRSTRTEYKYFGSKLASSVRKFSTTLCCTTKAKPITTATPAQSTVQALGAIPGTASETTGDVLPAASATPAVTAAPKACAAPRLAAITALSSLAASDVSETPLSSAVSNTIKNATAISTAAAIATSAATATPSAIAAPEVMATAPANHWVSYANEISTASELKADRTVNSTPVTSEQPKVNVHTSQANGVEHIQEETNFTKASILKSEPGNQTMPADDLSPGVTILHNSTGKEEVNAVSKLQDCNISASHCQSLKTSNTVPLISNHASVIHPTNRSTEVVSQSINLANSAMIIPPPMSVTNLPAFHLEAIAVMSTEIEGTFPKLSTESDEALDTCLFMVKCSPTTGDSGSKPLLSTTAEQNPCDISSTTTVNRDQTASISIPDQCAGSMEEVFELAAISANAHKSGSTDFTSVKAGEPQIAVVNPMIVSESESICVHQDSDIPKDDLNRKCDYLKENKEKMMLDASPLTNFGAAVPHYLPLPESNLSVGKLEYNSTTGCTESKESFPVPRSFNCGLVKQKKIDLSVQIVEEANNPKAENNKGSLQQNSLAVHQHGPPEYHGLQSVCGAENTWDDSVPVNELHISNICTLVAGSAFYDPQIAKIVDAIPSTKVVASQRREDPQESTNEKDYHFISNKNNRTLCMLRANGQTSVDAQLLETIAIRNDSSFTGEECVETTSLTNQQIPKYGTCKMVTIECGKDTPLNKEYNHEAYLPNSNAKTNEENSVDYCPGTAATTEWVSDYSLREEKNVQDHPCRGNKLSTTDGHSVSFPLLEGVEDRSVHEAQCFNKCLSFMTTQKHKEHSFANNTVSTQDVGHQLSVRSDLVEKGELLLYKSSNFSPLGHLGSENQDLGKGSCANGKAEQSKEKCAKRWSNVMQDSTNISLDNCKNKEQSILGGDLYIFPPVFSDDENEDPINKIQITLIGTDQMHALFPETATHFANQDNAKCSKITSRLEKEPATSDTLPISESSSFPLFRERETNSLFSDDPRLYLHSSLSFANHCSGKQENKNQKQTSLNSNDECSEMNFSTRHYACATNISLREHFRFRSSKENSQPNLPSDNIYRSVSEDKCRNRQHDIAQIVERKNVEGKNSTMIAGQKLIERDRFQLSNEEMSGKMKQCYSKKPRTKSRDKRHKVNASLSDDCKSVFVFKDSKSSTDTTYQTIPIIKLNCPDTHKGFLTEGVFEQLGNQAAVDNKRQTTEHLVVKIDLLNLLKTPDGAQNMKSTEVNCCITKANAIKMHNKRSTNGIEHSKKYMLRSMSKCLHSKTENTSKSCTTGTKVSVLEEPPEKQEVQKEKSFAAKVACSSEVLVSNSTQFQDSSVAKTTNSKSGKARFAQYRKRIVTIQEYRQHQKTQQEKSEKKTLGDELKQNKPVHKKKLHPRLKRKSSAQSHQACLAENMFKCLKSPEVIKTSVETHEQKEAYPGKYTHCVLLNNDHGSKSKMDLQDTCVKLAKDLISSDKVAADWQKTSFSAKAPKNSKKPYSSRFAFKTTTNENVFTTKWMVGTSPSKTSNDKNYKLDLNAKTPRPSSDAWKFRLREREPCRKVLQSCYLVGTQYSVGTLQLCSSVAGLESRHEINEQHLPLKKRRLDQSSI
ncbi:hypothetical protein NDU88_006154 [Pleurodeles waltl]|uniref:Uncharacterized protein n=1 Tax=Pleurodeles waltl TaxID=8319 RepID=A0AAV7SP09_PLEWA|nr:hypothetical protein NDU88_006154 [Pleurodeles waltl]